jgi:membrane protein DedA with SNARE-associated domain
MNSELLIYLAAFIAPFVQEDAAILAAVTAFLLPETSNMASGSVILIATTTGLVISDLWKYWIGFAGKTQKWAQAMAKNPAVGAVGTRLVDNLGKTLMLARFIPGTRIPAYIAAGFFGVGFGRFAIWIMISALAYVAVAGALLRTVGMVAGKTGQLYVAAGIVVILIIYGSWTAIKARAGQRQT